MLLFGSLDALSNEFFEARLTLRSGGMFDSGNEELTNELTKWTFKEKAVLRPTFVNVQAVTARQPGDYTVKDVVEYEIIIEQLLEGKWIPYDGRTDLQLEYTRMETFAVLPLKPNADGRYSVTFMLPDVYGLFTFKVRYNRKGFNVISEELTKVIRPLRNTHHPRFLLNAYPYYLSAFSMLFGVYLLSFVFLYHRDAPKHKKE